MELDTHNKENNENNELKSTFPLSISVCPGTLADGFSTYSPICLRNLFEGKKISHILPYERPQEDEEVLQLFLDNRKRISISGVQEKLSMVLEKNKLRLTKEGEQGTYILKPIPRDLKKVDQVPANEHLTMQIAKQVYGIYTAENAMIFFKDGTLVKVVDDLEGLPQFRIIGRVRRVVHQLNKIFAKVFGTFFFAWFGYVTFLFF